MGGCLTNVFHALQGRSYRQCRGRDRACHAYVPDAGPVVQAVHIDGKLLSKAVPVGVIAVGVIAVGARVRVGLVGGRGASAI